MHQVHSVQRMRQATQERELTIEGVVHSALPQMDGQVKDPRDPRVSMGLAILRAILYQSLTTHSSIRGSFTA